MRTACSNKLLLLPPSIALAAVGLWISIPYASGESVSDRAIRVSAVVQTNPTSITLFWPDNPQATNCVRYRKTRDATTWGAGTSLPDAKGVFIKNTRFIDANTMEWEVIVRDKTGKTVFDTFTKMTRSAGPAKINEEASLAPPAFGMD